MVLENDLFLLENEKRDFSTYSDLIHSSENTLYRGGSRIAATSKMERFVTIVNGFQPLTIITKRSILDVAAVLDLPLLYSNKYYCQMY